MGKPLDGKGLKQHSILDIRRNRDMKLWRRISSTNSALSDRSFASPKKTRQLRTTSHNYLLPKVQTSCFESFLLIDVLLIVTNICFPLLILLPCKLLRVCLRNEFLIKTFTIIIGSETYVAYEGIAAERTT